MDIIMISQNDSVSSADVSIVRFGSCGRSDVNSRYSTGPRTLL